ncbi:carbohydrate ABC transporter permease [Pseudarthrobacter sp. YS3]|uniref:carbohydrate ABC transporter permease n=1 Tax=Pseudarthrobacter sp. YS3 TaxID=3453718 RepID=UPI003EEE6E68
MSQQALEATPAAPPPPSPEEKPRRRRSASGRVPFGLLAPSFALMTVVSYVPLFLAVVISITALSIFSIGDVGQAGIVGLSNYLDVLNPAGPLSVLGPLRVSILFTVITTLAAVPLGVGAAVLVNQKFRGRAVLRTVMLIPFILPHFVTALIWRLMFQSGTGAIDQVLRFLGIGADYNLWLIGPNSFWALTISSIWSAWPFVYIMALAALQAVPAEYYDAAEVDGAGIMRRFWSITVPSIKPTLVLAVCLSVINQFNSFTLPFVLLGHPPSEEANVLPIEIYTTSFTANDYGHASAIAVVNLLVLLIPIAYYLKKARSDEN